MRGPVLRTVLAVAVFGLIHSLLATNAADATAAALIGRRNADGLYRPFYLLVALLTTGGRLLYLRRLPATPLYTAQPPLACLLRAGQGAALAYMLWGFANAGPRLFFGWDSAVAWVRGDAVVPAAPDGQGPTPAGDGTMLAAGPYAHTRHPLNWAMLPSFWLTPRMTDRRLAFNLAVTAYIVAGTVDLDRHLAEHYGTAYRAYQESVPFFYGR